MSLFVSDELQLPNETLGVVVNEKVDLVWDASDVWAVTDNGEEFIAPVMIVDDEDDEALSCNIGAKGRALSCIQLFQYLCWERMNEILNHIHWPIKRINKLLSVSEFVQKYVS